jgi:hypothetical protein
MAVTSVWLAPERLLSQCLLMAVVSTGRRNTLS